MQSASFDSSNRWQLSSSFVRFSSFLLLLSNSVCNAWKSCSWWLKQDSDYGKFKFGALILHLLFYCYLRIQRKLTEILYEKLQSFDTSLNLSKSRELQPQSLSTEERSAQRVNLFARHIILLRIQTRCSSFVPLHPSFVQNDHFSSFDLTMDFSDWMHCLFSYLHLDFLWSACSLMRLFAYQFSDGCNIVN